MGRSDQENAGEKDFMGLGRDTASCAEARKHAYASSHVRRECKHMYNVDPHLSSQHYADAIAIAKSNILDAVQRPTAARWLYNHHQTDSPTNGSLTFPAMGRPDWSNAGGGQQLFSFNSLQDQNVIERANDAYQIMHARGHDNMVLSSTALNCNLPANSLPDQGRKVFPFVAPVLHEHTSTTRVRQSPSTNSQALTTPFLVGGGPFSPSTRMVPAASSIKPSSTQLTIFYAGKVNVYNDVSSSKAKEIMLMAAAGNSLPLNMDIFSGYCIQTATPSVPASSRNTDPLGFSQIYPSACKSDQLARDQVGMGPPPPSIPPTSQPEEGSMPGTQSPYLDDEPPFPRALPLARKASLARFLEKRKERVVSNSPYPVEKTFF